MERSEIKSIFQKLDENKLHLTPYQADFVISLKRYFHRNNKLSARQTECLIELANNFVKGEGIVVQNQVKR